MRQAFSAFVLLFATSMAYAGSVKLYNDAPFPLVAEVLAADGTLLGKQAVKGRETVTWEGGWSGSTTSETPYTVRWICPTTGKEFSVCAFVGAGAMVSAGECDGNKNCPQKKSNDSLPESE